MGRDMGHRVLCGLTLACLAGWAGPLYGFERGQVERSVVRVINITASGFGSGSGTVINANGDVLPNHHVIDGSQRLSVVSEFSNGEHPAQIVWESAEKDLAVIRASGLRLPAATLFSGELEEGSSPSMFAMGYPGAADRQLLALRASLTNGVLSHSFPGVDWSVTVLQHSAVVSGGNSGGPLFDDCGRVVGVNTQRPHVMTGGGRVLDNSGINWASDINESINLLRAHGIDFSSDGSPCVSAAPAAPDSSGVGVDEESRRKADAAESKAESAEQGAQQAQQQAESATQTAQEAQTRAEQATQAAEEALQADRLTKTLVALVAVVTLVALGLALRKPRQELVRVARQIAAPLSRLAQSGRRKKPDIALIGFDAQGRPVRLMLGRTELDQQQGGYTVGRHPLLVDHVLNRERVSKRHARFSGSNGAVFVEDLNSSNGTRVNGTVCPPFQPMRIRPGDMVDVGGLTLRVSA